MISYHPLRGGGPAQYAHGFCVAPIDDVQRLATGISSYVWSPIVWKDGRRHGDNFLSASWLVLDFDSPEMTLAQAINTFCDCTHIIGTTKSHQKDKGGVVCDRYRVCVRFTETITDVADYLHTMAAVTRRYPCDPAPKDAGRFFWPCVEIVSTGTDGYTEDVQKAPPPSVASAPRTARYTAGVLGAFTRDWLTRAQPAGHLNEGCYRVAKDLLRLGMDPDDILARIIRSPTYNGKVNPNLLAEIGACIRSAINAHEKERKHDQCNQNQQRAQEETE